MDHLVFRGHEWIESNMFILVMGFLSSSLEFLWSTWRDAFVSSIHSAVTWTPKIIMGPDLPFDYSSSTSSTVDGAPQTNLGSGDDYS